MKNVRLQPQVKNQGPLNSVDLIYAEELGLENGASDLIAAVADVPKETPVSVVYCSTNFQALAGLIATQLLWPRDVQEVHCSSPSGKDLDVKRIADRGGVAIFMSVPFPSDLGESKAVGPYVHVVKIRHRP